LISNVGVRIDSPTPCSRTAASLSELRSSLLSSFFEYWNTSFVLNVAAHYFLPVSVLDLLFAAGERKWTGEGREEK
jgi:hypothetical protein